MVKNNLTKTSAKPEGDATVYNQDNSDASACSVVGGGKKSDEDLPLTGETHFYEHL